MNARNRHLINVLSTGVLVTILTLVGLFWFRWHLHLVRFAVLHEHTPRVQIRPTGLFPFESANDPNLTAPSGETVDWYATVGLFTGLGAPQYYLSNAPGAPGSNVLRWEEDEEGGTRFYFDPSLGLVVYGRMSDVRDPNGTTRRQYVMQFAGPEGIAEAPGEGLGRFISPVCDRVSVNPQVVYDEAYARFFAVEWREGVVRKGPELTEADAVRPVQIGALHKNPWCLRMTVKFSPRPEEQQSEAGQAFYARLPRGDSWPELVLDESGRIDLLDSATLTLTRGVGRLPKPLTFFENSKSVGPKDVAAFSVYPVTVYQREAQKKWAYVGSIAATASRDLAGVQLTAFDPNGGTVSAATMHPSPDDVYLSLPGASLVTVLQYVVENVHPPAAMLLSSLTASNVPADSDYQSLVLVPNSFAAMAARDADLGRMNRFASSLFFMLPAIVLGVFLAWRVSRDALQMGLSKQERTLWILGAFVLGLPVYITYRLTRPTVAFVTCANCGQGRRADFEKCQRCGALWTVPELVPPAWRVLGEPELAEDGSPSRAEEMNQSA